MTKPQENLVRLFDEASNRVERCGSPRDAEPQMSLFLQDVLSHPEEREFVIELFKRALNSWRFSWQFLQFCFHGLRWEEMRQYVYQRAAEEGDIQKRQIWSLLLESFEDNWDDADFYKQFKPRSPHGEQPP